MAIADDRNVCESGTGEEAIAACGRLLALDPNDAVAYYHRGRAYQVKNDYDQAIADYDQAIRLDPNYAHAYYKRGYAYANKGDYDRAISDFD
jgi:tetratricopeptide (TPR) repeat protein